MPLHIIYNNTLPQEEHVGVQAWKMHKHAIWN